MRKTSLSAHLMIWAHLLMGLGPVGNAVAQDQRAQEEYVGDAYCKTCHAKTYLSYRKTGHPYKLQKINGGPPVYPPGTSPGVPAPPADKAWDDITYIIGGFGWQALFLDREGYILTGKTDRQYVLANPSLGTEAGWNGYRPDDAPRVPYTCGACHTTGWVATGPNGLHQEGLPGIHGTWAAPGVTCEGCHGPGGGHVSNPTQIKLTVEERCGDCHRRGDITSIDASDGLIVHQDQYEDLLVSPHRYLRCTACHNPHRSVKYKKRGFKGTKKTCLVCHAGQTVSIPTMSQLDCATCHMPRVVKSAVSVEHRFAGDEVPEGDIRGHIFRISTDPDWKLLTGDRKHVRKDIDGKAYLTVDYACMSCHADKDRSWALEHAAAVHKS